MKTTRLPDPHQSPWKYSDGEPLHLLGIYQHFKGKLYQFRAVYVEDGTAWLKYHSLVSGQEYEKPLVQAVNNVVLVDNVWVPRFKFVGMPKGLPVVGYRLYPSV